jgi:FAD/FMN-containing dehydrogenase
VAIAQVADARDVQVAVDFARDHGLQPILRNGSHSFAGYSTGDGLVIDVRRMAAVRVDSGAERARLGSGGVLYPTYRSLWRGRRTIGGGTCPTVGVTGLTLGGGLGVLSRRYGVTSDRVTEVELVTADGKLLRADETQNQDLYWASRGGGGGNFGVVTSLTFELIPVDMPFTVAEYEFPWHAAQSLLAAWQEWLPTSPHETWTAVELTTQAPEGGAPPSAALVMVHAGPRPRADALARELIRAVGSSPTGSDVHSGPFVDVGHSVYCKGLRPDECAIAGETPAGEFPRSDLYSKSDVARGAWPEEGLNALVEGIRMRQEDRTLTPRNFSPSHTVGKVLIEAADGAVNAMAPDATAFVHRDNLFVIQYQARWRRSAPHEVAAANLEWTDDLYERTKPYRSGSAYQDYIDPELEDWQHAYYGANLDRLRRVKAKYDPDDLFRFAQSIPPAGSQHA